jgi:hypothetical protein
MPIKKMKNKIIDVTSDVLSAVPQWKAKRAQKQADYDVKTIKRARSYDNSQSDEATMARTAAYMVKKRLTKKNK